jgi:hypothetical protein
MKIPLSCFYWGVVTLGVSLFWTVAVQAATITATSVNEPDVIAAYNAANSGDTIVLPSGTSTTWNSTLFVSKPVTIQGQGVGATILSRGSSSPSFIAPFFLIAGLPSDSPVRITGIEINNVVVSPSYDTFCIEVYNPSAGEATFPYTQIRIDHCKFSYGKRQIWWQGWCYGVVDHCTFYNHGESAGHVRGDGDHQLQLGASYGTRDAVYWEDNTFIQDNNIPIGSASTDFDFAAVSVWRYNTFDYTGFTKSGQSDGPIGTHGNQGYWTAVNRNYLGMLQCEIYNNTFKMPAGMYRMGYLRGGRLIFANNTITTTDGSMPLLVAMTEEEDWRTDIFGPLRTAWPAEQQVNNSFFYGNTYNGFPQSASNFGLWNSNDGTFIQQNRDYWLSAPDPTTVTNYPKPGSPPSSPNYPYSFGAAVTSYTPLVYPHPLITEKE